MESLISIRYYLLTLILLLSLGNSGEGIDCLYCKSCSRIVEETFTITCEKYHTKCLKAKLISGEIERVCADDNSCSREGKKAAYESVYCCDEDNCNTGSTHYPSCLLLLPWMTIGFINIQLNRLLW
ncbi:uncharacterized protein [Lepeophtheirus salmonis]|uniref:Uncharacterized protein n=1 Tax=Lepeophtheirus salmonis TaxID=72036 RepID=A0A0K2VHS7_LEPSM|nr:uncharacterized protein LOC121116347 [Lepeophtheirus salmonis]